MIGIEDTKEGRLDIHAAISLVDGLALDVRRPAHADLSRYRVASVEALRLLARYEYSSVLLGLDELTGPIACELVKWQAAALIFAASTVASAEALLSFRGIFSDLVLPDGLSLDEASTSALASARGSLTLGVNDLSPSAARALALHEGELRLSSAGRCSPAAVAELVAHRGNELVLQFDGRPSSELYAAILSNDRKQVMQITPSSQNGASAGWRAVICSKPWYPHALDKYRLLARV